MIYKRQLNELALLIKENISSVRLNGGYFVVEPVLVRPSGRFYLVPI
jgi:hypothetical protein